MSSGYGVYVNSMGYHLKETSVGHLQVQGKLHLGNSNKTGWDITFSSGALSINPYTADDVYTIGASTKADFRVACATSTYDLYVDESLNLMFGPQLYPTTSSTAVTTAATSATYTAAGVLSGLILRSAQTGATTDTLPTAALLVAALGGPSGTTGIGVKVGSTIIFRVMNQITTIGYYIKLAVGSGGSLGGSATKSPMIHPGEVREFLIRITSITSSSETYDLFALDNYDSTVSPPRLETMTLAADATAGNITLTAAMFLAGALNRTGAANRSDTLPTAALLVAAFPSAIVGTVIKMHVINGAAANTWTCTAGSGGTALCTFATTAAVTSTTVYVLFTNVTASSEAYSFWIGA